MLISAARDGHLEVVRALLNKYADVEAADCVSMRTVCFTDTHFKPERTSTFALTKS